MERRKGRATRHLIGAWIGAGLLVTLGLAPASLTAAQDDSGTTTQVETQLKLAEALRDLDRREEAIEAYRVVLEATPDRVAALVELGALLAEVGERDEALGHLEHAATLDPANSRARYELAEVLAGLERWKEAVVHYRAVLELAPGDENATLGEVEALAATGQFSVALAKLEAARYGNAESRGLKFALSWLLATCPDGRLRDGERALELAGELFTARRSLAAAELVAAAGAEAGQCAAAAEMQRFALGQVASFDQPVEVSTRFELELEWYEADPCRRPEGRPFSERPEWPRNRAR